MNKEKLSNDENYNLELNELKKEYMIEAEKALKESEELYEEMKRKVGHTQFLSQSIDKPIIEFDKKYRLKIQELNEKYKK